MNIYFDIFKLRVKASLSFYRKRDTWTKGVMNRTKEGRYVFFLDYDLMKMDYIEGELEHLQLMYDLGDIHVFQSSQKGFHAVSFAKLTAKEYVEILNNSSCDSAFKNLPRFSSYRNWVLRWDTKGKTPRPVYLKTINAKTKREQSSAHHKFYSVMFPEMDAKLINPDKVFELTGISYATGGNV